MIVTLTLNPAIDRTIKIDRINPKDVTRVKKTIRDAAGKGINVSKVIASLGGDTVCSGFLAGVNGEYIKKALDKLHIENSFIDVQGETRENIKLHETELSNVIEINEQGPSITTSELDKLTNTLYSLLKQGDILVISGSIPKGVPNEYYKNIIEHFNHQDVKTVLDTSLDLLKISIEGKPFLIKPNLFELEKLCGKSLSSVEAILIEAKNIVNNGIKEVIVSLGKDGVLYVNKEKVYKVTVPEVDVESTVGAGDSFVAGYSYGLDSKKTIEQNLLYAASVATASCMTEGTQPGSIDDINEIYKNTKIEEVE